jgi:nicotinamide mononucleotide transporter
MHLNWNEIIRWLQINYVEIIAVITGLLYILFTIKEKILLWLFGILSSGLYVILFFRAHIYAYSILYIYYVIIGFYGWYNWRRKEIENDGGDQLHIRKTPLRKLVFFLILTLALIFPLYYVLKNFTDSDMALMDAILTSGGMVATWMLTQKYVEQWIFWIIIDLATCGVMIYKNLYLSAFLFLVYAILAWKGNVEWNKEIRKQQG